MKLARKEEDKWITNIGKHQKFLVTISTWRKRKEVTEMLNLRTENKFKTFYFSFIFFEKVWCISSLTKKTHL